MRSIFILLIIMLSACAPFAPYTNDQPGYAEAAKLAEIAQEAKYNAAKNGTYFDCSDYALAAKAACDDCTIVVVDTLDDSLLPSEKHAFTVTADGWVVDILYPTPYEHDESTYLLRHYQKIQ